MIARILALALLALALPASPTLTAAATDSAPEGLREVSRTYRRFDRFHVSGTLTIETNLEGKPPQKIVAPFRMAGIFPGRTYESIDSPQMGLLTVSDSTQTWVYVPSLQQYARRAGPGPQAADSATASRGSLAASLFSNYRGIVNGAEGTRELPAETLKFEGKDHVVRVTEVTYPDPEAGPTVKTFWIEPTTRRVLRHRIETQMWGAEGSERRRVGTRAETVSYDRLDLDRPVPDSLFTFVPPVGARQVERIGNEPPSLAGKPAIDFALKDLAGKEHRLNAHRGKVVMLDFWATWCGPCRMQMPLVEKLGKEFAGKGLVVYAVNEGEPAEKARAYLKRNSYSTTTLLDPKGEVGNHYGVTGIPTLVVIDRVGTISSHFVGVHGEEDLRQALRKAGIE